MSRAEAVAQVERITSVVHVPVSADIEGGYGESLEELQMTVAGVVGAGAVGLNLEDTNGQGYLRDPDDQGARLRGARSQAEHSGVAGVFINARTDIYLLADSGVGREDEVLRRAHVYAAAGADCLFVPGLHDLDVLARVAERSPLPINVMASPGGPGVAALAAAGVRRITLGTALSELAISTVHDRLVELLNHGKLQWSPPSLSYSRLNALMPDR